VSAETTFPLDIADLAVVQTHVLALADRCAARLRADGMVGRTLSVKVRTSDFRTLTRSRTLTSPTDVGREIYLVARELLAAVDLGGLPVRLVGVRAEGLEAASVSAHQPTFAEVEVDGRRGLARRDAELVMDHVRARFGGGSIQSASTTSVSEPTGRVTLSSTTAAAKRDLS